MAANDEYQHHRSRPHDRRQHARSRSRSPYRGERKRRRSRTPQREPAAAHPQQALPFGARALGKHDYRPLKSLFALYLDVQKQLVLEDLEEREAKGRWKSFVNKWNRGELAEGWYDPETYTKAQNSIQTAPSPPPPPTRHGTRSDIDTAPSQRPQSETGAENIPSNDNNEDSDEDDYGPSLPTTMVRANNSASATIPSLEDLALRRETEAEDHNASLAAHRADRKSQRQLAASRLDELVPRAEPGTRERQLEKKREVGAANRSFAAAKTESGNIAEVGDDELMGGGDGVDEYKRAKKEQEKKKSDRDLRREEILRAKQAEREERMRVYREKEAETMKGLIELAKARFGQ